MRTHTYADVDLAIYTDDGDITITRRVGGVCGDTWTANRAERPDGTEVWALWHAMAEGGIRHLGDTWTRDEAFGLLMAEVLEQASRAHGGGEV